MRCIHFAFKINKLPSHLSKFNNDEQADKESSSRGWPVFASIPFKRQYGAPMSACVWCVTYIYCSAMLSTVYLVDEEEEDTSECGVMCLETVLMFIYRLFQLSGEGGGLYLREYIILSHLGVIFIGAKW